MKLKHPETTSILFALSCGVAKELIIDDKLSALCMTAKVAAIITGHFLNKMIQYWDKKHKIKDKKKPVDD